MECGTDFKALFLTMGSILHAKTSPKLPEHENGEELANRFANYFRNTIFTIRETFHSDQSVVTDDHPVVCSSTWVEFHKVDQRELSRLVSKSPSKSCILDSIPTWMVKILVDSLTPSFSNIINKSLSIGEVPIGLKTTVITPVLKKPSLDHNILKNFRPVSNLPFVSKLLERVVVKQLTDYMTLNNLHESLQSAYKSFHSTESALLKVHNDIMRAMDQQNITILLLLDLSAAFDTIDHKILLSRMESHLGIGGNVLKWFQSYLSERTQKVQITGKFSTEQTLIWGVPQGSVLGPVLFLIYTLPLGDVIRRHGLELHIYADDTQIYFCFRPVSTFAIMDGIDRIQRCVLEVQEWMAANLLKLNADKTEILILGSRVQLGKFRVNSSSSIAVPICQKPVRNLEVMFDSMLSMEHQVVQVIKSANYHLRNINRVCDMLTLN